MINKLNYKVGRIYIYFRPELKLENDYKLATKQNRLELILKIPHLTSLKTEITNFLLKCWDVLHFKKYIL